MRQHEPSRGAYTIYVLPSVVDRVVEACKKGLKREPRITCLGKITTRKGFEKRVSWDRRDGF